MNAAPKVTLLILLSWPMTSDADVGDIVGGVEPSHQYSISLLLCDRQQQKGSLTECQTEVRTKQKHTTELLHGEKVAPTDIHQHLLNADRDQTADASSLRWWAVCFSSGNRNIKGKPCSR